MAMPRKQIITDLYLDKKDIQKLLHGHSVHKRANKHCHAIRPILIDTTREKKIKQLKEQLARLEGKPVFRSKDVLTTKVKRSYTKRNPEYWVKRSEYMKEHGVAMHLKKDHRPMKQMEFDFTKGV